MLMSSSLFDNTNNNNGTSRRKQSKKKRNKRQQERKAAAAASSDAVVAAPLPSSTTTTTAMTPTTAAAPAGPSKPKKKKKSKKGKATSSSPPSRPPIADRVLDGSPPGEVRYTRDDLKRLPPFPLLTIENIEVCTTLDMVMNACQVLTEAGSGENGAIGFDSEWKPMFKKGEKNEGPHLIQLCTLTRAYLFPVIDKFISLPLRNVLESPLIRKVGSGLSSDNQLIPSNTGVNPCGVEDVAIRFGYRQPVGVVQAIALLNNQFFRKSGNASRSNWSRLPLTYAQISYAGNDAYAALRIHYALKDKGL
jgi:hypothetical protein